jgi:uncharacterized protein YbjT (DUF2867 family)
VRVLVTGANGFIGARVVAGLSAAGHDVVTATRAAHPVAGAATAVACDFARDLDPAGWQPRLTGIDAVVNCAGILRETRSETFQRVHVDAPLVLFRACAAAGVRRVIQLSALGEPADGEFIASKHRGDVALVALDLDALVLRPSLVYSAHGAYGGTSLLRAIAALPGALIVPRDGSQLLRPLALEDLVAAIVTALAQRHSQTGIVELVGPQTLTLREYLRAWREWFGLVTAQVITTPDWLVSASIAAGEFSGRGPLCRVIGNLLERARIGATDALAQTQTLLGRPPVTLAQALQARPCQAADLLQARWYFVRPLLLIALALVWIASGATGLLLSESAAQAALPGWPPTLVRVATLAASGADLLLGAALLLAQRTRRVLALMLALVALYTIIIGISAPMHWLDPFGGLLKNIPIAAVVIALLLLDDTRR